MRDLNSRLEQEKGIRLAVRLGIHTGVGGGCQWAQHVPGHFCPLGSLHGASHLARSLTTPRDECKLQVLDLSKIVRHCAVASSCRRWACMTKAELVDKVAVVIQLPKHQTTTVVDLFLQCITDALGAGDNVELRGFGSFRLRH